MDERRDVTYLNQGSASPRIDIYGLLSALLVRPPSAGRLEYLTNLDFHPDIPSSLSRAVAEVKAAAGRTGAEAAGREYQALFAGGEDGEIVPYASWYMANRVHGTPMVPLDDHLAALHIQRRGEACDREDHAAALCELMVLVIAEPQVLIPDQAAFFNTQLAPWMPLFFEDLRNAPSADFYRPVGNLGGLFKELEKELLKERVNG